MGLTFRDWRSVSADVVRPLLAAECERWERALGWNYRPACAMLEGARCHGRLPGLLAYDTRGAVVGWSYYMLHAGRLHIGALLGGERAVVSGVLDAVLQTPEARAAGSVSCFLYPSIALDRVLSRAGFVVTRHAYLGCRLPPRAASFPAVPSSAYHLCPWSPVRVADVARLFAAAYEGMPESRCFTTSNDVDEWVTYLAHITSGAVCGDFNPVASAILETGTRDLAAVILVTELARPTMHVAQIAVAPSLRRQGLAASLVRLVQSRAAAAGCTRLTLLVADTNTAARRLYQQMGFEDVDAFVFGYRRDPQTGRTEAAD